MVVRGFVCREESGFFSVVYAVVVEESVGFGMRVGRGRGFVDNRIDSSDIYAFLFYFILVTKCCFVV